MTKSMGRKTNMDFTEVSPAVIPRMVAGKRQEELEKFSETLYRLLEEIGLVYCLLEELHPDQGSLIACLEVAIDSSSHKLLPRLLEGLRKEGYLPLQRRRLAANDCRYDFATSFDARLQLFTLTIREPFPRGQRITIDREVFSRRQKRGNCWVAHEVDEYRYLLSKVSMERKITELQQVRLKQLAETLGACQAEGVAARLFGDKLRQKVVACSSSGQWAGILKGLRGRLKRAERQRISLAWFEYAVLQFRCTLQRWFEPGGIYVVILGPDGAGKSTLVNKILELLGPLFESNRIFQWRPQMIKPRARYSPYFNPPHAKPPHGSVESILRILAVIFDYWVGYPAVIRPLLARDGLIIYDRDFHDLLVDRLRYRYGGPHWLPDLAAKIIPHPETLFLTLDAEADIILSRKQEVALKELRRQRVAYTELAGKLPNSTLIRTDLNFEASTSAATGAILTYLERRFEFRQQKDLRPPTAKASQDRMASPTASSTENAGRNSYSATRTLHELWTTWGVWLVKGFMAVTDQGLISGSNFVLSIILARYLSASQYGTFAIAYSTFVLFSLVHQALVLEPMSVLGPSLYRDSLRHYMALLTWLQLAFSASVVLCLAAVGIAGSVMQQPSRVMLAFIGMGVASPFVLLFWFARRAYYLHLLPGRAVIGAIAYSALLCAGISALYYWGVLSPFSTFLVMGISSLLASILLLLRLPSVTASTDTAVKLKPGHIAMQHWRYGGWAFVSMVFFWVPWNIFYSVVTHFSGLEGTGTLKALLNLALPITATYSAFSMLFLPYTARLGAEGGWKAAKFQAWKIAGLFVLGSGAYWLLVCLFRNQLIHFFYKGQYTEVIPLVPVVAVASVLAGAAMGPTIAIKAMRSPATVSGVYFGSTLVSILIGVPACWGWGYRGAVWAILLSSLTTCIAGFLKCSDPKGVKVMHYRSAEHQMPCSLSPAAESDVRQELL
jgi:O-antigen/teichoic acid export membrane protein/thymidylate kinase